MSSAFSWALDVRTAGECILGIGSPPPSRLANDSNGRSLLLVIEQELRFRNLLFGDIFELMFSSKSCHVGFVQSVLSGNNYRSNDKLHVTPIYLIVTLVFCTVALEL